MTRLYRNTFRVFAWKPTGFFGNASDRAPNAINIRCGGWTDGDGIEHKGHRVEFNVEKSDGSEPNKCDLTITNLAETTRTEIAKRPLTVQLSAGYDGNPRLIFWGDMRYAPSTQEGTEWLTKLELRDGDRAYWQGFVNRTYSAGTDARTVLRDVVTSMGLAMPRNLEVSPELAAQFSAGFTAFGPAREELTNLLAPYGYRWTIQDGTLVVLKDREVLRTSQAWVVDRTTGMIGSPVWSPPGDDGSAAKLTITALLWPELQPGQLLRVSSRTANGTFKMIKVKHSGSTHGQSTTTVEARPL